MSHGQHVVLAVHLPIGSELTGLWCQMQDDSPGTAPRVRLYRYDHADNSNVVKCNRVAEVGTHSRPALGPQKVSDTSIPDDLRIVDDFSMTNGEFNTTTYYGYTLLYNSCSTDACRVDAFAIGDIPPE